MQTTDVLTLIALVVIPIFAVLIGQYFQNRAKKHDEKMYIFKVLMTDRIYGRSENGVQALNMIDVVFANSKKVRNAWKEYRTSLSVANMEVFNAEDAKTKYWKLLETISDEMGYRGKITWDIIQKPYVPEWLWNKWEAESNSRKAQEQLQVQFGEFISQLQAAPMGNETEIVPKR